MDRKDCGMKGRGKRVTIAVKNPSDEKRKLGWIWQKNNRTQTNKESSTNQEKKPNEPPKIQQNSRTKKVVILDVGGDRFTAKRTTLNRFPTTRLGRLVRADTIDKILENCDEFFPGDPPEYFFDRNPDNFPAVLNMYRTNKFHTTGSGCALVLQKDLEYWGIDPYSLEACCALKYFPEVDVSQSEKEMDLKAKMKAMEQAEEEDFGSSTLSQWRSWLWNTMEYPWTSNLAQFLALFSLSMVLLSTVTFIISTADELQKDAEGNVEFPTIVFIIDMLDNFVIIFFSIEYVMRLIICPRKIKFLKQSMNVIDILAIAPFYISLLLEGLEDFEIIGKTGKIVRLVRVMRILRIFKLVRHFAGLQSLIFTLQQAYQELGLLLLLVVVAILTYSSLVYFAERERDEGLNCTDWKERFVTELGNNIGGHPCYTWTFIDAVWWGLMTITTVGYDLYPKTLLGKLTGGICALSGVFILTLPIPIVVNSFAAFYNNRLWRTEVEQKKKEKTLQIALDLKSGRHRNFF